MVDHPSLQLLDQGPWGHQLIVFLNQLLYFVLYFAQMGLDSGLFSVPSVGQIARVGADNLRLQELDSDGSDSYIGPPPPPSL